MDKIIILDFGGQYCDLISRRIRDIGVCTEIFSPDTKAEKLKKVKNIKGIVFSGGAFSVFDKDSPKCDPQIFKLDIPILGICYGHQLIASVCGGYVNKGKKGEYGITILKRNKIFSSKLFKSFDKNQKVWMNHSDQVVRLNKKFKVTAFTENCSIASFENDKDRLYGVQFHPEVFHTENGNKIISNFVFEICKAKKNLEAKSLVSLIIAETKNIIGKEKAIIGLSGGIDSSVAAVLMKKAIGDRLTAVYIDTGLMRYKETDFIKKTFSKYGLSLKIIKAQENFLRNLKGVTDPEKKRKVIGKAFIEEFDKVAKDIGAKFLVQGTIYSDRIESGHTAHSSVIKSHHNVGGLPKRMNLKVFEPLKDLYKDEVRQIALKLKLPRELILRHVFPGPGLGIRILGEITKDKARIVRMANFIVEEEIKKAGLYEKVWMAFAVLLPVKSVGIQGDSRSYKFTVVVRVVESKDAMTAHFSRIPYPVLESISTRITNEIKEINRVVYDISNKPPSTMEWE